ncbi:MAG: transcriptional regulator, partial [Aestuariivirga sp.]
IIWDEAEEVTRLARISHPRIPIDTSGLNPLATELANRLADDIGKLEPQTLNELLTVLSAKKQGLKEGKP